MENALYNELPWRFTKDAMLELDEPSGKRSLKELPRVTMLLDCPRPAAQPPTTTCPTFRTNEEQQHITEARLPDAAWLLGRGLVSP